MSSKTVSDSEVTITELMIPAYANFSGKVHGGTLLSLMDKVAYVCATKYSRCYCVTVAVERVEFMAPVEVGELVSLFASVNYVGRSSMIIGIRVESLQPSTGEVKHTNTSMFTMVAKDADGYPTSVPTLMVETELEARRFLKGKYIKEMSKQEHQFTDVEIKKIPLADVLSSCAGDNCIFTLSSD